MRPWTIQGVAVVLTTAMLNQPALADGLGPPDLESCRRTTTQFEDAPCIEREIERLTARLQDLVEKALHGPSSIGKPRTAAEHDRWLQSATMFCSGIATTEPIPTFEAALLDCFASVLSDRVATLEDTAPDAIRLAR
jgi:hypothetical protein